MKEKPNRLFFYDEESKVKAMEEAASPLLYAGRGKKIPPILFMHGDKDRLIHIENSVTLFHLLQEAGNDVQMEVIPGQGHGFFEGTEYYQKIYRFLDEKLVHGTELAGRTKKEDET